MCRQTVEKNGNDSLNNGYSGAIMNKNVVKNYSFKFEQKVTT